VIVYTGGSSEYFVQYASGGYVIDDVSTRLSFRGGEAGGVAGSPPGEHTGMCLLGIAVGVPRDDVLSDRCGGGVGEREGMGNALLATAAAMLIVRVSDVQVQLKAHNVDTCNTGSIRRVTSSKVTVNLVDIDLPFPIETVPRPKFGYQGGREGSNARDATEGREGNEG
jgi:hypothetical protein